MADECTDMNGCEMLSIMVSYQNDKEIIESFVAAVPVASTAAEVVTSAIVEQMKINNLYNTNLAAVAFAGASNMSGTHAAE